MLVCRFCAEPYDPEADNFDRSIEGFWCDLCDGFTYFNNIQHHRFTLILEEKGVRSTPMPHVKVKFKNNFHFFATQVERVSSSRSFTLNCKEVGRKHWLARIQVVVAWNFHYLRLVWSSGLSLMIRILVFMHYIGSSSTCPIS